MRFLMRVKQASLLVGLFCCAFMIQSSTGSADETQKKKPILAFFVDDKGHEFGGVIARTLAEEQVVWLGTAFVGQSVDMRLYRMSEDQFLDALAYEKGQEKNYEVAVPFKVKTSRLDEVSHLSRTVEDGQMRTRVTLPISEPGVYYLEGVTGTDRAEAIIVVSNIVAQAKEEGPNLAIWTVDNRTGKHVEGGEVVGFSLQGKKDSFSRSAIDEDGIGRIDEKERGDLAIVHALGETAFIPLNYAIHTPQPTSSGWWWGGGRFIPRKNGVQSYLYTDRSLYQPGDTVYFKAFAREDDDARYRPAQGQARVKIYSGWGEDETVVLEKNYPLSGNGTFDGSAILPKDLPAGSYYTLLVSYPEYGGNENDGYGYGYSSYQSSVGFMVDNYRKPEFGLDVIVDHDRFIVGDMMKATISGSLFSGEPLAGKQVSYTVTAGTYYDYGYYSTQYEDEGYRYGYGYGSPVQEGVVVLDANGQATVEVMTKSHEKFLPQVYRIEASSTDSAQNPVFESQNALVVPADFTIYRTDYGRSSRQGEETTIPLILVPNQDGARVANRDLDVITKMSRWIREEVRPGEKYPRYHEEITYLDLPRLTTGSEGKVTLKFTPPESASYEFTIIGTDDRGNKAARTLWIWASNRDGYYYQGNESDQNPILSIETDKDEYRPTEAVRLTLSSNLPDRDVWVTFERDGVHRTEVVELHGNTRTVELPLVETDMPNTFISATIFSRTGIDTASKEIAVSAESKRMELELKPDKERYLPGETVSLEVIGTDYNGKLMDGEIGVWAIDKALFELMDQAPGDIFKTFWSKRYSSTQSAHSLQGILFSSNAAEMGGCFTGDTLVFMADGSEKPIRDIQPGEMILTRADETDATLVPARVGRVHTVEEDGYIVINDTLRVTAPHRMFVDGRWQAAGDIQIGSELIDSTGNAVQVKTIYFQREDVTVYNLMVEQHHTFFADGVWVHNSKDGGVRSVFKDTAYWNPKVRLGEDGKARVTFKLPDNTTTWVISAVGATMATQVGQTRAEIMVSKHTIIRPALPELMRVGDRVEAVATISNNTDERINYAVKAKFDAGSIVDGADRTLTVEPHSTSDLTFLLLPENLADAARFTVVADAEGYGEDYSDGIESVFPVRRAGFLDRSAEIGMGATEFRLALLADMERGASTITLDLASSLLGTLPTAMKHLVGYPYGCVEQTTSRFVPIILARKEKELFADALVDKDTDAMLAQGVKNLTELQHDNGSWGFWHEGDSNPYLTAYVVEYLLQARTLGVKTNEINAMLDRVYGYLTLEWERRLSGQEQDSSEPKVSSSKRQKFLRENATDLISIAYARMLLGMEVAPNEWMKGDVVGDVSLLDPNILALSVMTNIRTSELDPEKNGVNALVTLAKQDAAGRPYWTTGSQAYYASQDASTALAIRALTLAQYDRGFITSAVRYLDANRKPGYWSNTFATVQVAAALLDHYRSADPETLKPIYAVLLDGKELRSGTITSPRATISIPLDMQKVATDSVLSVQTNGEIYSTLSKHIMRVADQFDAADRGLQVNRRYTNRSHPSSSTLALGDTVQVDISVSGVKRSLDRLVIEDHLPAGMVAIRTRFKNEGMDNEPYWNWSDLSHIDEYTEDGVIVTEDSYDSRGGSAHYLARVVSTGEFTVPPAHAELMYAPEASGYSSSEKITLTHEHDFRRLEEGMGSERDAFFITTAKLYRIQQILVVIITLTSFAIAGAVYLKSRRIA